MSTKLQHYTQLADFTATKITGSFQHWTDFLTTAARLYKYPYHEQLMIYAQRPEATACAEYDLWNKQMGRYVRRDSKGIALIDTSGERPRLKYVFDVADTGGRENSRRPFLWEYRPEAHEDAVTAALEQRFGIPSGSGLDYQLEQISYELANDFWEQNKADIIGIVADSYLEVYDDYNIEVAFKNAVSISTTYALMSRCGMDVGQFFQHEDFMPVFDFNTPDTVAALGSAVSQLSEQVLRQIEVTIKKFEREQSRVNAAERTDTHDRTDLHPERGLPDPQPEPEPAAGELPGQVREDAEEVPSGASPGAVEPPAASGEAVPPSEGDRQSSPAEVGADDAPADAVGRSDGGAESQRPDAVDRADEQPESTGRGNDSGGAGVQLTQESTIQGEQFSFFPTEAEQIAYIAEAESAAIAPSAFSMPQDVIDHFLRLGSNTDYARIKIVTEFMKQKSTEEIAVFLQKIYHGGYGIEVDNTKISAWYAEDGIHLAYGGAARYARTAQILSWVDAAARIGQLLEDGQFATNVELAEAPGHERKEIAEALWNFRHDFSNSAIEQGYLPSMENFRGNSFPDETVVLADALKNPDTQKVLTAEYRNFYDAYQKDKSLMRFHYQNKAELLARLSELSLPRREYASDMVAVPEVGSFITEDEIAATLASGSSMEGSKSRIYPYFTEKHTPKEQADFLKNEYGLGGRTYAVSRASNSSEDHSGKGLRLRKGHCPEVLLNWNNVAKRISELVQNERFFTPEEKAQYEVFRARETARAAGYESYNAIKEAHPDDIVLFQVGDFFEMYGEDARTAAQLLDLSSRSRPIPGVGRVEMCGIPSHALEENIEKLRQQHSVTVSAQNGDGGERSSFSMAPIAAPPALLKLTQDDIDESLRLWNGNVESKRAVVRYMRKHGREKGTAAWLSREYDGSEGKSLFFTKTGNDIIGNYETVELSWPKIQRRIAQLIQKDEFFTDYEKDHFENIDLPDLREHLEPGWRSPFVEQVMADVEAIAGAERIENEASAQSGEPQFSTEVEAVYPAEENRLPYDVVVERLHVEVPGHTPPTPSTNPVSIPVDGEWQEFPNAQAAEQAAYEEYKANIRRNAQNFRIEDDHLGEGGPKAKFQANINAIKLLKELEASGSQALPEQQEVLSRYVGWGGLADAFDPEKENWRKEYVQLKELLTPEEYSAARSSTLNAHYTSPTVIRGIYEAVERMGFQTGNILEPSMGVGNFFGLLPDSMSGSRLYGVELDSITGRIAKQLYPKANITVSGFEKTDRRDFFDLAIGNVPFGQYQVHDPAYNKLGFSIHNYFFAKSLDQVRPGGVVAFVTSRYMMDAKTPEVRKYLAQRAELLGAIRLPNNAFKANAGTEVVSDIVFLQKRDRPLDIEPDWVHLGRTEDGFAVNSYFVQHPEMVLGNTEQESTAYGMDYTVTPIEGLELADQLHDAVKYIRGSYQEAELPDLGEGETVQKTLPADPDVKNYSYTVVDGEVYFRENSVMVHPELNATAEARVKGMVALRNCVHELIDLQMDAYTSEAVIKEKQAELNQLYDDFSRKHGIINDRANRLAFSDDSSYYLLCALEVLDEDGNLERKADMFTKRTIQPHRAVTEVDTASEALAVSIAEKACVDMEYMSQLSGKTREQLASELTGVIFPVPESVDAAGSPVYVTADEYLSGNVRLKLRQAERALMHSDVYAPNVEALKAAQPKDLDASEIEVRLGATWIDKAYIRQFMYETFDTPRYLRGTIDVKYAAYTAEWQITNKTHVSYNDVAAFTTYGTDRANAYKILEDSLNLRDVRIYDTVEDADGKERRVLNAKETTLAAQKQQAIRDAFKDWIWRDPERRRALVAQYNEEMNSIRPREYDGSHIVFSGMNPEITLREHQKNAIAHVLYGGNTLLAHEVGAGKTFEMVAAAMESKRLGLCRKSMFVVPNHLTEQWASEFLRLYPSANILVTTKKDFETHNRKKFCARIATGDYDAVIIGHSQFERIPISQERQERLLQEQIWEITEGIAEVEASGGERFTVKQLERTKKGLEARLEKLQADGRKDDVISFEQLGVDRLFVDEAHNYKNLFLYTKMRNVAGLSTTDAQKSSDMFAKCRYMDEITGSRGVVFATGTPVSNSMTELYTMQRYLQYERLRELNMIHFDCWASRFGETATALELAPEGTGYRARTRFSKFFNLPELMNIFKEVADIKTADQLHLPTPEVEYHNIVAQPTAHQKDMVQALSERAAAVHTGKIDPSIDNMLKITSDGRKLGLDQRIINGILPDEEGTKVNQCVENIMQIWRDGQDDKLTQLVFCDISTPKAAPPKKVAKAVSGNLDNPELHGLETSIPVPEQESAFTVYEDIRQKLIAQGVPSHEIAFIHEANTEVRKKELFAKVRSGQVRVLMGSTSKMGAGTNVQDRLVALHDLDCPWRPGDLAQRKGRIERQGNQNPLVHVYRYVTEGTFDAYLWQTVENKQKFISQIMTSKFPVRSCDDVDETALSFAEIKALCAGDPRIKERMDLDVEVSRLKLMKADHQSKQFRLEDNLLTYFPEQIEQNKGFIKGLETDMQTLAAHPHPVDGFSGMEVRGDTLTDKENAGAALLDACKEVKGTDPVQIGSYRGFTMSVTFNPVQKEFSLVLRGDMTHRATLGMDARGNLTRIENALAQMPERLTSVKAQLENLYQQQAAAKEEVGKPFPFEADLKMKTARLVELDGLLNMEGKSSQPDRAIAKSARPSILDGLKRPVSSRSQKNSPQLAANFKGQER